MSGTEAAAEEQAAQVARLLQAGLDRYGEDDIEGAIRAWTDVLELDRDNPEARDYLESAGALPDEGKQADPAQEMVRSLLDNARELLAADEMEAAFDLLSSGSAPGAPQLDIEATIELVRSQLVRRYRAEIGDLGAVPVVNARGGSLTGYNLPTEAGFMLSLVDGATPVQDMITLAGMDAFEALRLFRGLLDAGIVELRA